jgi:hypothetical protein
MPFRGDFVTKNINDTWAMLREPVIHDSNWFKNAFVQAFFPGAITFETLIGFVTDFASVPRLPIIYMFLGGRGKRPATNHDDGYARGEEPKRVVDLRFYEGLIDTFVYDAVKEYLKKKGFEAFLVFWKIPWRFLLATLMWCPGVVVFGWGTWLKYKYRRAKGLPLRPEAPECFDDRWEARVF